MPTKPTLPHAPPMHWLDDAVLSDDGTTIATRFIGPDHPFVQNNEFPSAALIELLAQAAAAGSVMKAAASGKRIRRGVLASIKDFQMHARATAPATITLHARPERSLGPLTLNYLEAHIGAELIASARMTFHLEFE